MNNIDPTSVFDRPIAFNRGFVNLGCGITGALLLSQAVYWSKRTSKGDGWFYKTATEWEEETGLSRREQETARAKLRDCGVLLELKQGLPCKTYFCIDFTILFQLCGFRHTGMHESAKQVATNTPNRYGGMSESSTETTTETTTDIKTSAKAAKKLTKAELLFKKVRDNSESYPALNCIYDELLTEWAKLRIRKGASDSDRALSRIETTLETLRNTHAIAPDYAIGKQCDSGWTSIEVDYFVKGNQQQPIHQDDTSWGNNMQAAYIPNQQKALGHE
jgi:hypothetical protein